MADQRSSQNRREVIRLSAAMAAGLAGVARGGTTSGGDAQDDKAKPGAAPAAAAAPPAARAGDVGSLDAILAALYDSISGPPGPRDGDRIRSLFHPGARLIPCGNTAQDKERGLRSCRVLSVDEFLKAIERAVKEQGFFEKEIARRVDRFGAVAQVFSTYESRRAETDRQPFVRGINSIQLFFDGKRWWVITIFWDSERPDQLIPGDYLPTPKATRPGRP
jgi:hypothetical protein